MYELKKIGKLFTSKFVGTGPSSYEKRIYRAAVSQSLRNTGLDDGRNRNSKAWPHTDYRYSAIWPHCHLSAARTNCQSARVTDTSDVMADSSSNDQSTPSRSLFVPPTRLLTAIQFTTANHYMTLRSALGRPKAVHLQTDPFPVFPKMMWFVFQHLWVVVRHAQWKTASSANYSCLSSHSSVQWLSD